MAIKKRTAVIIGAGPAGLTAAYELTTKTDIKPVIFEVDKQVGGISKTINFKGNRFDLGGHRFFSKSELVMNWWRNILPLEGTKLENGRVVDPEISDEVMLIRNRRSRILFLNKLFDYPVSLSCQTLKNLGLVRTVKIIFSYLIAVIKSIKKEKNLEDFFINRFGKELYKIFFKDYTEKLWGVACCQIKPEWGAQRIRGISFITILTNILKRKIKFDSGISQKKIETSLISKFLYPKFGPGQLWEKVADIIKNQQGEINLNKKVEKIFFEKNKIISIRWRDLVSGKAENVSADYFFSSMPIKDLVKSFQPEAPSPVVKIAENLRYRDFITVGLLLKKIKLGSLGVIKDNWIYLQDKKIRACRLQIFNNWSPYLVKNANTIWLGMEYVCDKNDDFWQKSEIEMIDFAVNELSTIGIISPPDFLEATIVKFEKAYPSYFGSYDQLDIIKKYLDRFYNLFLIGRNGLHRYNNMDHSMLTAITAVDNIKNGITSKDNIWRVNTEEEYHESK